MKTMSKNSYIDECFKMNEERTGCVNHFERYEMISKMNDLAPL